MAVISNVPLVTRIEVALIVSDELWGTKLHRPESDTTGILSYATDCLVFE
jgi:hypothetical protein